MTTFDYLSMLSYSLTALGYIMTNMLWLRVFMIIACLMDACIFFFIRQEPLWVQVIMNVLFVLINSIALYKLIQDRFPPKLYGAVGEIYNNVFHQLTPSEFKLLLSIGEWRTVADGVILIHEGDTNIDPMLITAGNVLIEQNNTLITTVQKGAFLGEINFLTNIAPKNHAISKGETQLFVLPRDKLMALMNKNNMIKSVIYSCFGCNIAVKLKQMNDEKSLGEAT